MDDLAIYEDCDLYTAFPEADDVFYSDYENECMLPLGIMHVDFNGKSHDVLLAVPTISDKDGLIGWKSLGERCGELWLTYSKVDGKWALDCLSDEVRGLELAPDEVRDTYEKRKATFRTHNCIYSPYSNDKFSLLRYGDEVTTHSNLYAFVGRFIPHDLKDIPDEEELDEKLVIFEGEDGGEYIRLGRLSGWVYSSLSGYFVFFYNHDKERVLVVVEYD